MCAPKGVSSAASLPIPSQMMLVKCPCSLLFWAPWIVKLVIRNPTQATTSYSKFVPWPRVARYTGKSASCPTRASSALRIWIAADGLFARDSEGVERLTDAGRRRLDSAMVDFVRYPRDSPLVVEGYAESQAGEASYLMAVDRAQLVRDYLLARFRRQTTLTGIMPMSDLAPGSPSGDGRWSGVVLALFVDNAALGSAATR